jgi:hypothetical protein
MGTMRLPRPALVPVLAALLVLTGCSTPEIDDPQNPILADDLDLDSYHVEGSIDGLTWIGDLCALNLIPSFSLNAEGKEGPNDQPFYVMQFEAYDKEITGGVVTGMWRLNDDVNYTVQINSGTWSSATSASAQEPGTISVQLEVSERPPAGGRIDRTVTGALNLTPVVTSDECIAMNDVDYLKESLETYGGPTGGGM